MGQKLSSPSDLDSLRQVDERKVKSRITVLRWFEYPLHSNLNYHARYNWIRNIMLAQRVVDKEMDYSQPSDLISKLSKEIAKMFTDSVVGLDERGKIVSNHLFQSRKELIEDFAERIRLKDLDKMIKNKNKIKSKDVNVTNQLVGYLLPLLRVNELKIKSKIEPKTMELANYIIQIYICINTLARHATTNDANLMLNTYNEQMVSISISLPLPSSSSGQLCSFHDQLFVSNLTINFFVKKIPKEIISIILEYDQISGERLLESGVEDVIYQRASLFKKQNENNF